MRRPLSRLLAATFCAAFAVAAPQASSSAAPQAFHGEYTVSFLGLSVASARFDSRYENEAYSIRGSVSTAGLAQIFDDTHGTVSTSGRVLAERIEPAAFRADYKSGKKTSLIDIRFEGGKVVATRWCPSRSGADATGCRSTWTISPGSSIRSRSPSFAPQPR